MPFFRFLGWNALGASVWCTLVITVGYLVGDQFERVERIARSASHWIEFVLVLGIIAALFYWWRERQQGSSSSSS
jgi:membrane protein DedA with SNARE-associated domain